MTMERPQASQLGHICIRVKDLDATIQFYHGLLGMPIVERRAIPGSGSSFAALGSRANYLEVFPVAAGQEMEQADPASLRLNHICLCVEQIEELEQRAAAAGHPFTHAIRVAPSWVGAALKVGWVIDPDGNRVELLEWTGPAQE